MLRRLRSFIGVFGIIRDGVLLVLHLGCGSLGFLERRARAHRLGRVSVRVYGGE